MATTQKQTMCNFKSGIVVKDAKEKGGFRLLMSPWTESHSELEQLFNLRDGSRVNYAKVEFSPPTLSTAHKVETYKLRIDEVRTPDWFDAEMKDRITEKMTNYIKTIIVDGDVALLLGGQFIIAPKAKVECAHSLVIIAMIGGSINSVGDSAQIGDVGGSAQISYVHGSAQIGDVGGSAQISYVRGSAKIGSVRDSAKISYVRDSAKISYVRDSAQIGDVRDSAQIGDVGGSAQISYVRGSAQISYVRDSAQISYVRDSAKIGDVGGSAQIGDVRDSAKIGDVGGSAQIGDVRDSAKIINDYRAKK